MNTTVPATRQDYLDEAVATASQITETDLTTVLGAIVQQAKDESKKTTAYATLFEASHKGLRGILDEANHQMTKVVLDTMTVLEEKGLIERGGSNYVMRNRVYYMLKLLPVMCIALEFDINSREGWACEKDKVRQIVYEAFMKILELKPEEQNTTIEPLEQHG